ncbi:hypothetical protein KSZ_27100 [Dictyobacter formicarum]|uniref:N-acetyltransferase domain-containing protein n=2 Tax=Dictyobacter formicarum TaxID=2778368 RepID=A0ABQ3VEZ1_9CHLR|nr:hypothetical protein KSZ_27100 [Dictyobacter formicarum]
MRDTLQITIKPVEEAQLDILEQAFDPDSLSKYHYKRFEVQKSGAGVYLIAWHNYTPVGHFLLYWSGPYDAQVTRYLDITSRAFLQAGATKSEFQRRGVATALIQEAERLAAEKRCTHIGLEVGSTDNPGAKRLYEKLGYVDWGRGEFEIQWEHIDKHGNKRIFSEMVTYMQKSL